MHGGTLEHTEPSVSGTQLLEDDIQESGRLRTVAAIQIRHKCHKLLTVNLECTWETVGELLHPQPG